MACPRCTLQLPQHTSKSILSLPHRRNFHTTPRLSRLGAATYAQEWNTGTYHFNKSLQKTLPVAQNHVNDLLTAYATQQKRPSQHDPSNPVARQLARSSIAAQRRREERVFISRPTVKDFGDRVEVQAFLYDGVGAKEREEAEKREKRKGVKADGTTGEGGQRRRAPARRRGPGAVGQPARGTPGVGYRVPGRAGGVARVGGTAGGGGGGGGVGTMTGFRRVAGIGSGPVRRDEGAAGGRAQR